MLTDKGLLAQDPDLVREFKQAQQRYLTAFQKVAYTHFSTNELFSIFKSAHPDKVGDPVFFVFGMHQPYQSEKMERLYLLTIKWFQEQFKVYGQPNSTKQVRFTIVYFNNKCNSYLQYMAFRGVYRSLPLKYIQNVKRIVVVNPGLAVRTLEWIVLGTINKHLRNITCYVETIRELEDHGVALTKEVMEMIPEQIMLEQVNNQRFMNSAMCKHLNQTNSYEIQVNSNRQKIPIFLRRDHPQSDKMIRQKPETNKPLPFELMKKRLEDYVMCDIEVPLVLKLLICYLQMRPEALSQEGIFRRSASILDQEEAIAQIYNNNYDFLQKIQNPHIVANLVKKFLVHLSQPVIPYIQYNRFIHNLAENSIDVKLLKTLVKQLPKVNYITLQFVLGFFRDDVISRSNQNKMTEYNVAVVLSPCLFRSEKVSMEDFIYQKKVVKILQAIFGNFEFVFGSVKQQELVLRQSSEAIQQKFQQSLVSFKPESVGNQVVPEVASSRSRDSLPPTPQDNNQKVLQKVLQQPKKLPKNLLEIYQKTLKPPMFEPRLNATSTRSSYEGQN